MIPLAVCPHCLKPIPHEKFGAHLSALKLRIVDAIAEAGDGGISGEELIGLCWANGKKVNRWTVSQHIYQLNQAFGAAGARICSKRGKYYIASSRPETTAQRKGIQHG